LISIVFSLSIYILSKVMKKEFGMADILILLGIGFYLSVSMYISYIFVFLFISLLYSFVLIFLKKKTLKSALPLVPFMYFSIPILVIFSNQLTKILESLSLI
jgi:prepilin signal peptidase PulO-like enzyme (type II secretory pathway)